MSLYFRTGLAAVVELMVLFLVGGLAPFGSRSGKQSVSETLCAGFVIYYAMLEVTVLPLAWAGVSLYVIFCIWAGELSLMCAISVVLHFRGFFAEVGAHARKYRFAAVEFLLVLAGAGAVFLAVLIPSGRDVSGTIAQMTTDLYHDSAGLVGGLYGETLTSCPMPVMLSRYHIGAEFYCALFEIPCLTQMKLVQQGINVLLSLLIAHRIFYRLTGEKRVPSAIGAIFYIVLLFTSRTSFSSAGVLVDSAWTGNGMLVGILLPGLLLILLGLYEEPDRQQLHVLGMCAGVAAVSLSRTSIYLFPIALCAGIIPLVISKREPGLIMHALLWMVLPLSASVLCVLHPVLVFAAG